MKSYSQAGQDLEALMVCGQSGYFIDFGCNDPIVHNNTALLELNGWRGLLVDIDQALVQKCSESRSAENFYATRDLSTVDIKEMLKEYGVPSKIDYISFDVDDANLRLVRDFPYEDYQFKFATIEHDLYRLGPDIKNEMQKILLNNGYSLYRENVVAPKFGEFEDWYINEH